MIRNKILVPTNFSRQAYIAFIQSLYFSKKTDSEIFLLHVIPKIKNYESSNTEKNIEIVQKKFEKYIDEAHKEGVKKISYRIECGRVFQQVLESEEKISPDFIFMGTDASASEVSSITMRLIDNISCPIVVFRGKFNKIGCENIILPLDLTKETRQKVELTIKLAKIYGSVVHIVSVTNAVNEKDIEKLNDQIKYVQSIFVKLEIKCTVKLITTKNDVEIMANAINDYADDIKSDLIIIMTRQETKIQKFFVGSMAAKLIKKANVPILCVNPNVN